MENLVTFTKHADGPCFLRSSEKLIRKFSPALCELYQGDATSFLAELPVYMGEPIITELTSVVTETTEPYKDIAELILALAGLVRLAEALCLGLPKKWTFEEDHRSIIEALNTKAGFDETQASLSWEMHAQVGLLCDERDRLAEKGQEHVAIKVPDSGRIGLMDFIQPLFSAVAQEFLSKEDEPVGKQLRAISDCLMDGVQRLLLFEAYLENPDSVTKGRLN